MPELEWYYPENLGDMPDLLNREGVILHGGGTGILRGGLKKTAGLIDLGRLRLNTVERRDGKMKLGAGCTYAETVHGLSAHEKNHVLVTSLGQAASTPLRNRITLGGSIALFPFWSDLMGPLLALEADGLFALSDYIQNPELRRNTLIVSVQWEDRPWHSAYHRHTRTRTDRPMFSVSVLSRRQTAAGAAAGTAAVEDLRIVVVGCSGRYHRCTEVEALLVGKTVDGDTVSKAVKAAELGFPARMCLTPEYLEHCVRTVLERSLHKALGG